MFLYYIIIIKALVLRGLDALTTNESIIDSLGKLTNYCVRVKNTHIARDPLTNVSSGFAFVEFGSIQVWLLLFILQCYLDVMLVHFVLSIQQQKKESSSILQLSQPFVELDGKSITISYSKNNFQTA